jgi:flagellar assembly protein FliH
MPSVIKAGDEARALRHVEFNFEDMAQQANAYLEKVQAEARESVAKANREAESIRLQAKQEAYQAALKEVERITQEKILQQMQTVLPALEQAVQEIQDTKSLWLKNWEQQAVHLAGEIACRVIRRELEKRPEITLDLIRETLELATGSAQVRLCLNPGDYAVIENQLEVLLKALGPLAPSEVVSDEKLTPGGCRVETRYGVIDNQIETQVARIEQELSG